jgi:hypothetical protein
MKLPRSNLVALVAGKEEGAELQANVTKLSFGHFSDDKKVCIGFYLVSLLFWLIFFDQAGITGR